MTEAIKLFKSRPAAIKFAEKHNGKIATSMGGQYFVRYLKEDKAKVRK